VVGAGHLRPGGQNPVYDKPGGSYLSTQQCPTNYWRSIPSWQWVRRCCDGKVILSHTQCIPASVRKWWFMGNTTTCKCRYYGMLWQHAQHS